MNYEVVPIEQVINNPDNPRVLKDDRYETLKRSLSEFPEMLSKRPLVVVKVGRKKHMVLGGNARLKACVELGMREVPVIHADEWSEEQRKAFIIKDNVNFGDWDWEALANVWNTDELKDWGLEVKELEPVPDYALLDDTSVDNTIQTMEGGVKRAIMIEFNPEDYNEAFELVKQCRQRGFYVGQLVIDKLKVELDTNELDIR